jgi:putative flippase GtrA
VFNPNETRISKFAIVGLINTAINLAVLNVLIIATGTGRSGFTYGVFEAIGFLLASLNSYIMNRQWTFQDKFKSSSLNEFSRFLGISVVGLAINLLISLIIVHFLRDSGNPNLDRLIPSIGAVGGVFISQFWNYHGYRKIFRKKF